MTKIQILGTGCPKCKKLAENAEAAVKGRGDRVRDRESHRHQRDHEVRRDDDPALAIDGQVKIVGKVPSPDEIKKWLV